METKAEKFFEWLREQAQAGEYIKGYRGAKGLGLCITHLAFGERQEYTRFDLRNNNCNIE